MTPAALVIGSCRRLTNSSVAGVAAAEAAAAATAVVGVAVGMVFKSVFNMHTMHTELPVLAIIWVGEANVAAFCGTSRRVASRICTSNK